MTASRAEIGNMENEAGVSYRARDKHFKRKKKRGTSKGRRNQPERVPSGQSKKKKKIEEQNKYDSIGL